MKLKMIGESNCGNGPCPTIYESETGTIIVQGFDVKPSDAGLQLPPGEGMVEIPRYMIEQLISRFSK